MASSAVSNPSAACQSVNFGVPMMAQTDLRMNDQASIACGGDQIFSHPKEVSTDS